MRVAFIVGTFPVVSETFIIHQVAALLDRGIEVEIFAFLKGRAEHISSLYEEHHMARRTHYFHPPPKSRIRRMLEALPGALGLLFSHPHALFRALNVFKYGHQALSLKRLYRILPFAGKHFDLVHCHFGTVAVDFLAIDQNLKLGVPIITSLYGCDVSAVFKSGPVDFYDRLKRECALFLVMSDNMKRRVVANGFPAEKVKVHPVSIDVDHYRFAERCRLAETPAEIMFVGRFVEKKGLDDLLRALAIVRQRSSKPFRCSIIGGGPLEEQFHRLATELGLNDVAHFKGYMKEDDLVAAMRSMHMLVSPSKTAGDGDME